MARTHERKQVNNGRMLYHGRMLVLMLRSAIQKYPKVEEALNFCASPPGEGLQVESLQVCWALAG